MPITGGKATQFTKGMAFDSHPKFSPDGKKILMISDRSGGENICVVRCRQIRFAAGVEETMITYQSAEWTPSTEILLWAHAVPRNLKLWLFHKDGVFGRLN